MEVTYQHIPSTSISSMASREDLRRMAWNKAKPLERESQSDPPLSDAKNIR